MFEFWSGLSRRARIGIIAGVSMILMMMVVLSWYLLRTEYQVLFSDLKPQDAQAMTVELERQKIPYKLGDNGTSILVDQASVHSTRIKLMGKDFPLHGAVGFELFNNTDFGMTEFAQKINYQRALQGELTRTILSLAEVRDARVHLALPEQGLFKQATARAKASINLTMREGQTLRPEQVTGIQRLVAAAVPGMNMQDVTIIDHRGLALTRVGGAGGADGEAESGARLDLKREMENHLSRKAGAVLDGVFGPGQALVSVDVTLNMEQMRVTTEDVIASPSKNGAQATGVVIRERETMRDVTPPLESRTVAPGRSSGYTQRDVDYAVGRRVEQVIAQPGSVRRIHALVVVRQELNATQEEKVQRLLAAAVGAVAERGDTIVVQAITALAPTATTERPVAATTALSAEPGVFPTSQTTGAALSPIGVGLSALCLAVALLLVFRHSKRPANSSAVASTEYPMNAAQRAAALNRIQQWMQQGESTTAQQPTASKA